MSSQRSAVLLQVTNDALIVANDGRPVSRLGVLALCASDLSEKSGREDEQPEDYPDTPDSKLLQAIADSSIAVYRADANRPKRDLRHERGVTADYGGRYLWELLQNADDALADDSAEAAELIGTKGLGFISVLEITDRPEIFSRPFAFYFSKVDTERLLHSTLGKRIHAPTFEIPHPAVTSPEIAEVLQQGYSTAIRLPFRNAEIADKVRDHVEQLDYRFLLILQRVARLQIEVGGQSRKIDVRRSPVGSDKNEISFSVRKATGRTDVSRWTKWSRQWKSDGEDKMLSVGVCLPLDDFAAPRALAEDDKPPVHVFFPTDEIVGARAIVHASLDVTENRKHFRISERNSLVYPQMRDLVAAIVVEIPAEVALDAFGCIDPKGASGAARDLAATMLDAIKETPFVPTIGSEEVRPRDVVVWTGKFGKVLRPDAPELKQYRLLHPSVSGRNAVLEALQAKTVNARDFFGAMRFCKNNSPLECERAVDVLVHEGLPMFGWNSHFAWLEEVPCWWTEEGSARSIAGRTLLFSRPRNWPKSVPADALSAATRRHLTAVDTALPANAAAKHIHDIWRDGIFGQFVRKSEYLEKALLPAMEKMTPQNWEEHGWDILRVYREWSPVRKFEDVLGLPIVYNGALDEADTFRRRLSRALHLPTDKGWRAAEQCYAGKTWGAPKSFRAFFENVYDRAVVKPLRSWREPLRGRTELDAWKGLLRFAGVAWEPKLVLAAWDDFTSDYRERYLTDFNRRDFDLQIEYFPKCLESENGLLSLLEAGRTLQATAQKYPAKYLAPSKQKSITLKTNFARHQLEAAEWLPHKKSLLFPTGAVAPADAYLAGKGIEGLLPEITLPDVEPKRKNELLRFLRAIGIKDLLPLDGIVWLDWMRRLADAPSHAAVDKSELFDVARTLYRRFFNGTINDFYASSKLRVPCFAGGEGGEHLTFARPREAKWLDEAIFEAPEIRQALLAHGYRIFILFLSQAEGADRLLRVGRLSEAVSLTPISSGVDEQGTTLATALYLSRIHALRAVIPPSQRSLLTEELRIEATSYLSISMCAAGGREIATTEVRSFRNRHGTLMISGDGEYYRSLGLGLAHHLVGHPRHTAIFENILSAADDEEVLERLRDQGIPAQELEAVHTEMLKERAAPKIVNDSSANDEANTDETDTTSPTASVAQPTVTGLPRRSLGISGGSLAATKSSSSITGRTEMARGPVVTTMQVQRLGTQTWTSGDGGHWDMAAASEAGRHAEDWLHTKLIAAFPGHPIARNERDASNRESDFVIQLENRTIHIEAKRLGTMPGQIYWSNLEFAKCRTLDANYCMAILLPQQNDYQIAWIWRPLIELANAERFVEWIWNGRRSDQLPDGDWEPTSPPLIEPPNFTYRVFLTPGFVGSLPTDAADLALLKNRIIDPEETKSAVSAR